jgi:hypothetical protein
MGDPMRDKLRIPRICAELERLWTEHPDLRLGQIISNAVPDRFQVRDPFHIEDEELIDEARKQLVKSPGARPELTLCEELSTIINRHSRENQSDTPDFLIADFMMASLRAFEDATKRRDAWCRSDDKIAALDMIHKYGGIDGGHHKQWVLDQVVRALTGDKYAKWVEDHNAGDDGPNTYEWDVGIAP